MGAVLYQAITGARPFEARSKTEVMSQILSRAPMPPRRLVPTIPVEFEQIVLRLLDRDPERRYQRASDLLKDLETVRGLDRPAEPPPVATTSMSIAVLPFAILGDEDETLRSFRDGLSSGCRVGASAAARHSRRGADVDGQRARPVHSEHR